MSRLMARIQRQQVVHRQAVVSFVDAIAAEDPEALVATFDDIENHGLWPPAFKAVVRLATVSDDMRERFLRLWRDHGDHLRSEVNHDLTLLSALRRLLPLYQGPEPVVLYRGDSAWNRQRQTYGISWSSNMAVAKSFACGMWRTCAGGSVLLRTEAPAAAIISAVAEDDDNYGETEFIVDRRFLRKVTVVECFSQKPMVPVSGTE